MCVTGLRLFDQVCDDTRPRAAQRLRNRGQFDGLASRWRDELPSRMCQRKFVWVDQKDLGIGQGGLADAVGQQRLFLTDIAANHQQAGLLL
jgi:hypothetical protein